MVPAMFYFLICVLPTQVCSLHEYSSVSTYDLCSLMNIHEVNTVCQ